MGKSLFNGLTVGLLLSGCYAFFAQTYQVAVMTLKNLGDIFTGAEKIEQIPDAMYIAFIAFGLISYAMVSALEPENEHLL